MKIVIKGLAVLAFLAIAAYGLTRFLAAQESRRDLADAEVHCRGHGGIETIRAEDGQILGAVCTDGTQFRTDAARATPGG